MSVTIVSVFLVEVAEMVGVCFLLFSCFRRDIFASLQVVVMLCLQSLSMLCVIQMRSHSPLTL